VRQEQTQRRRRDEQPREGHADERKVVVDVTDDEGEDGDDERDYEKTGEE